MSVSSYQGGACDGCPSCGDPACVLCGRFRPATVSQYTAGTYPDPMGPNFCATISGFPGLASLLPAGYSAAVADMRREPSPEGQNTTVQALANRTFVLAPINHYVNHPEATWLRGGDVDTSYGNQGAQNLQIDLGTVFDLETAGMTLPARWRELRFHNPFNIWYQAGEKLAIGVGCPVYRSGVACLPVEVWYSFQVILAIQYAEGQPNSTYYAPGVAPGVLHIERDALAYSLDYVPLSAVACSPLAIFPSLTAGGVPRSNAEVAGGSGSGPWYGRCNDFFYSSPAFGTPGWAMVTRAGTDGYNGAYVAKYEGTGANPTLNLPPDSEFTTLANTLSFDSHPFPGTVAIGEATAEYACGPAPTRDASPVVMMAAPAETAPCRFRSADTVGGAALSRLGLSTLRKWRTCERPGFEREGREVSNCSTCGTPPDRRCGPGACEGYEPGGE